MVRSNEYLIILNGPHSSKQLTVSTIKSERCESIDHVVFFKPKPHIQDSCTILSSRASSALPGPLLAGYEERRVHNDFEEGDEMDGVLDDYSRA